MTYSIENIGGVFMYGGLPIADQDWARKMCWDKWYFSDGDVFQVELTGRWEKTKQPCDKCHLNEGQHLSPNCCGNYREVILFIEATPTGDCSAAAQSQHLEEPKPTSFEKTGLIPEDKLEYWPHAREDYPVIKQGEKEQKMSEAWMAWTEDQKTNPEAVNPYAFVYGWKCCKNRMLKLGMVNFETTENQDRLWDELMKEWHDVSANIPWPHILPYLQSKYTIHKK